MSEENKPWKFRPDYAHFGEGKATNAERAKCAETVVVNFAQERYDTSEEQEIQETVIQDLLLDIMHLCDRDNVDFSYAMGMAEMYHKITR